MVCPGSIRELAACHAARRSEKTASVQIRNDTGMEEGGARIVRPRSAAAPVPTSSTAARQRAERGNTRF